MKTLLEFLGCLLFALFVFFYLKLNEWLNTHYLNLLVMILIWLGVLYVGLHHLMRRLRK